MPRRRGAGQREKAVRAHGVMGVPAKWSTESAPTASLDGPGAPSDVRTEEIWKEGGLGRAGCASLGRKGGLGKTEPRLFNGAQLNTIQYLSAFGLFMYACMCAHMRGWADAVWCVRVCFFAICESWC